MPAGRPKITTDDFPDDWEKQLMDAAKKGRTLCFWCSEIFDITRDTLYRMCKDNKEFLDIINRARSKAQVWWEEKGRTNIDNKQFNQKLWEINMRNRFSDNWNKDKRLDITSDGEKVTGAVVLPSVTEDDDQSSS